MEGSRAMIPDDEPVVPAEKAPKFKVHDSVTYQGKRWEVMGVEGSDEAGYHYKLTGSGDQAATAPENEIEPRNEE